MWQPWIDQQGWLYLTDGHDVSDSKCQGGSWYYKGNKQAALGKLEEYKKIQAERSERYYSQPWV